MHMIDALIPSAGTALQKLLRQTTIRLPGPKKQIHAVLIIYWREFLDTSQHAPTARLKWEAT
jgi:hypothetical protein